MKRALVLLSLLVAARGRAAEPGPCVLGLDPPMLLPGMVPPQGQLRRELDEWPHFALRYLTSGETLAIVEPGSKPTAASNRIGLAIVTPHAVIALAKDDPELLVGRPGGTLTSIHRSAGPLAFDAAGDGKTGTWVVVATRGKSRPSVQLGHLDGSGKLGGLTLVAQQLATAPRIVRLTSGELLVAWVRPARTEDETSALWAVWFDAHGHRKAEPLQLDELKTDAQMLSIALARSGRGADVAWAPLRLNDLERDKESTATGKNTVPLEIRPFHLEPSGAPRALRRQSVLAGTWVVAGSAGGMLPIGLQAATLAGRSVFVWHEYVGNTEVRYRAMLADGEAVTLGDQSLQLGQPILRSDARGLILYGLEEHAIKSARLRCMTK